MPRGNPGNLTPFEKGHKKKGGRKSGTPNKLTREVKSAIVDATEKVGLDGKGFGGRTGFLIRLGIKHPTALATLYGRLISKHEPPPEPRHSLDLRKLTDDELAELLRLTTKAQPLYASTDEEDAGYVPTFDKDELHEKMAELMRTIPVKKRKKKNTQNTGRSK